MAQNNLSPEFCNGHCSSACLFESAQSRPGDVEVSEGNDEATVRGTQHCIFSNLSVFNWSAMYSALAMSWDPYSAPHSGSCPLWVPSEILGKSSLQFLVEAAAGPAPPVPFCFCRKSMVLCSIVDLSILRGWPWPCSMVQSSLMRTLNWSLLFFSDLLRDALGTKPQMPLSRVKDLQHKPGWGIYPAPAKHLNTGI